MSPQLGLCKDQGTSGDPRIIKPLLASLTSTPRTRKTIPCTEKTIKWRNDDLPAATCIAGRSNRSSHTLSSAVIANLHNTTPRNTVKIAAKAAAAAVRSVDVSEPAFSNHFEDAFVAVTTSMLNAGDGRLARDDRDFASAEAEDALMLSSGERRKRGSRSKKGRRGGLPEGRLPYIDERQRRKIARRQQRRRTAIAVRHALTEVFEEIMFDPWIVKTVRAACHSKLREWKAKQPDELTQNE